MSKKKGSSYLVEIPQGSLVLICGASNSGKTHFVKKHFTPGPNLEIFHTDDEFYKFASSATIFDTFDSVYYKTEEYLVRKVINAGNSRRTLVLDAAAYDAEKRFTMIDEFKAYFKNIVLIVIDPEEYELLKRGPKPPTLLGLKFNNIPPGPNAMIAQSRSIRMQLKLGIMNQRVNQMYHITSERAKNARVVLI